MSPRHPPKLATWLLDLLGYTQQNQPLAGDLLEDFRNGRSAAWYWRQTLSVIWNGAARNTSGPRSYCGAMLLGFAAQAAIAFTLWWLHSPPWGDGPVAIFFLCLIVWQYRASKRITGEFLGNPRRLIRTGEVGTHSRAAALRLVSVDTFTGYLTIYLWHDVVFRHFSLAQFAGLEMAWFGVWSLAPALLPAPVARRRSRQRFRNCWSGFRPTEWSLGVALSDGTTILLRPENLAESALVAADEELISVLFGRAASLELLRRAIWLGISRREQVFREPGAVSLAELASLIEEAGDHSG